MGEYQISSHSWEVIGDVQAVLAVSHMRGISHILMKLCQ